MRSAVLRTVVNLLGIALAVSLLVIGATGGDREAHVPQIKTVWTGQELQALSLRVLGSNPSCADLFELVGAHETPSKAGDGLGEDVSQYLDQNHLEVSAVGSIDCIS